MMAAPKKSKKRNKRATAKQAQKGKESDDLDELLDACIEENKNILSV